ncbi:MAG: phosphoribosylamine--glycine ligase [Alphaproteobacteria bacterium]|nr:phosphoribosylamine--glycine ligase [Alphaproteobacteria bacterium]
MNVLLIGSGGREHALAWALAASPLLTKLYCAPGNAGIEDLAECAPIVSMDFDGLVAFAKQKKIDFAVIGPDDPLVGGLWDRFEAEGIRATGPSKAAAVLEGSKGFVKDLCREIGIPTAAYQRFDDAAAAKRFAETLGLPVVVKADGLALGKGVIVAETAADAGRAIDFMFEGGFGASGKRIVVEEFMHGEEASFFALCDGENAVPLAGAQDHKRAFDGDRGPNTGGMGAYSPAPILPPALEQTAMERFIRPTLAAMATRGMPYQGVLYLGLMVTKDGPKLVEYNCRFGDPECQVLMMRLKSDLLTVLIAMRDGQLRNLDLRWREQTALTVVMATKGYPGAYAKGSVIRGLDRATKVEGIQIFHAGTRRVDGAIVANGGRVLNVTALGQDVAEAQARAYRAVDLIDWPEGFCRGDIGWRALRR